MIPHVPLQGRFLRLEPFTPALKDGVRTALDCDPETWEIMSSTGMDEHFETWWSGLNALMARTEQLPYAIRRLSDGRVIGTTSYLTLRPAHRGLEVGTTFIHTDARGGPANPEAKRLLLAHAFDCGVVRAEFMVDVRNQRSQAAMQKLGATREGTLRNHKVTWTGHIRDTAVYSITDQDWLAVRAALDERLAAFA